MAGRNLLPIVSTLLLTISFSSQAQRLSLPLPAQSDKPHVEVSALLNAWVARSYMLEPLTDPTWKACVLDDKLDCAVRELAGSGALNCGRVPLGKETSRANQCALDAFKKGTPFWIRYDIQPWDNLDPPAAVALLLTPDRELVEIASTGRRPPIYVTQFLNQKRCISPSRLEVTANRLRCVPVFQKIVGKTETIWDIYPAPPPVNMVWEY